MIKAKNLNFSYDKDKTFINNLNVEIEKGKVTTILGPNGSGIYFIKYICWIK